MEDSNVRSLGCMTAFRRYNPSSSIPLSGIQPHGAERLILSGTARLRYLIVLSSVLWLPGMASAVSPVTCSNPSVSPDFIRNEGHTEQVGDYIFTCTNTGGSTVLATLTATMSAAVTSLVVNPGTGATEAAVVNASSQTAVQGKISGNTVTFTSISVPPSATTSFDITNIRVDATSLSNLAMVTETVSISGTSVQTANFSAQQAATAVNGITSSVSNLTNYGAGALLTAQISPFTVHFGETASLPNAFKTQGGISNSTLGSWAVNNTETGYYILTGNTNIANSGTRVRVVLNNMPPGMSLYAPVSLSTDQTLPGIGVPIGTATATAAEAAAFSQLTAASTTVS